MGLGRSDWLSGWRTAWRSGAGRIRRRRVPCWAVALGAGLALAACKSPPPPDVEDQLAKELETQGLLSRKDERGLVLFLPDVLFEFDRADLTPSARTKIQAVAEIVVRLAPERTLSVEGHSDSVGTEDYNLDLSLRRAKSVSEELVTGGVAPEKIRTVGLGERFPVAPNRTAEGHDNPQGRAQNRRVEVVIERGS
jgi:outer membrane protein OmpA-like peptidoglycan-associated protein